MGTILVVIEHASGVFKKTNRPAISAARELAKHAGGEVQFAILGAGAPKAVEEAKTFGPSKIHTAEHEGLAHYLAQPFAKVVADIAKSVGASHIVGPATATGKDLLPRVAARLDAAMASDIVQIVDAKTYKRPMWAGSVIGTVELTTAVQVVSVRGTEFAPAEPAAGAAEVQAFAADPGTSKMRFVRFDEVKSERPDLSEANCVVSGGRGLKGPEGFKNLLEPLADLFKAAIGATRAVVDAGWLSNDLQVGQTGKVVAPDLYFAVGLSGAIQHVAGMKGSKVIVAINKDEEAPIFSVADYGLVADLFKAVPELVEEIKKARG
ncbi:MAG: electron transfer flavoprotein subunit alpha/FixB family protein [Pseudomonadota bacterium]